MLEYHECECKSKKPGEAYACIIKDEKPYCLRCNEEIIPYNQRKPSPVAEREEWCFHMRKIGGKWILFQVNETDHIGSDEWDICPMKGCHAPRPVREIES